LTNVLAFLSLLVFGITYALARGGAPERLMAAIILYGVTASKIAIHDRVRAFTQPELALLLVDLSMIGLGSCIALKAERIWPMLVVAALLAGVELQIGVLMAPARYHQVYRVCHAVSGYLVLLLLIGGTLRHRLRIRSGAERDWTRFT